MTRATDPAASRAQAGRARRLAAYVALTKPRIIELLLITTVPAMVVAADGWPGTWLVVATLIGGTLSAAGANTINSYLDRDIDSVMRRTSRRPLPTHVVEPRKALTFGVLLGSGGFLWLLLTVNALSAAIAGSALLFYVFVYTLALKRSTTQNIVIGGAAGAAPVLVGWAAVTGTVSLAAWLMFAIVFFWTPPHFWALALRYRDDYSRAGVPMLPSVVGEQSAIRSILAYTGVLVLLTILLAPIADLGIIYLAAAVLLGAWFLLEAYRLYHRPSRSMTVFRVSTLYLTVLFAAMVVDVALGL